VVADVEVPGAEVRDVVVLLAPVVIDVPMEAPEAELIVLVPLADIEVAVLVIVKDEEEADAVLAEVTTDVAEVEEPDDVALAVVERIE
jgi:hypothetical protein